ncbi:MAG: hypothetical protein MUP61_06275 [Burkholderiales bacterium]|nr:hypothetical protein [Burkholderiales bacterium]
MFKHDITSGIAIAGACQELPLPALRANRDFCADEKRIRAEISVLDKGKSGFGV